MKAEDSEPPVQAPTRAAHPLCHFWPPLPGAPSRYHPAAPPLLPLTRDVRLTGLTSARPGSVERERARRAREESDEAGDPAHGRPPGDEEARGTCHGKDAGDGGGRVLHRATLAVARDGALFRGRYGPICTIKGMPAGRAGPGRTASASGRLRWVQNCWPLSDRLLRPGCVGPWLAPARTGGAGAGLGDSDDSDAPGCGTAGPVGPVPVGRPDPDRVTRMRRRERGRRRIRRKHPAPQRVRPSENTPRRRCRWSTDRKLH